jgi:hypothetical protein
MSTAYKADNEQAIGYDKVGCVFGLIGAAILFGVAGFFWTIVMDSPIEDWPAIAYFFVLGPAAAGMWFGGTNLFRLIDPTPKVIIKPEGIVLCQHDPYTTIGWGSIGRARYSQLTENGHEKRARLTLVYVNAAGEWDQACVRIDRLSCSSHEILRTIQIRANLSDSTAA